MLTKVVSIYGYTNILWVPITLVNFLIVIFVNNEHHRALLNLLEWIIVAVTGAITGLSIITKIGPVVRKNSLLLANGDEKKAKSLQFAVLGALIVAHVSFVVLVKVSFFGIKA